ncbi:MAG: DUF167 family protein [Thiohalocapsa sp.]|jgi:uncharacterized protein (TIGR00251 family)
MASDGDRTEASAERRSAESWYRWDGESLLILVRAQPRAGRDAFDAPVGDRLRVRLRAPPVDGKANDALIRLLARSFGVPRRQVQIVGGTQARDKLVRIDAPARSPSDLLTEQAAARGRTARSR